MTSSRYVTRVFDRRGVNVRQKYADTLKDALALQARFESLPNAHRVEIFERHCDAEGFISYRPRVQVL